MLKKSTFKKIFAVSAIVLLATGAVACSQTTGGSSDDKADTTSVASGSDELETQAVTGTPLELPDVSADMKAKGEKIDLSEQINKYKPLVTLAEYKGVQVTKGDVYEMTDDEVDEELNMLLESFKSFDDVTEGGTTQEGDALTLSAAATLDGQPYENFTLEDQYYEVGSELIAEEFDKQLIGKKANEDFEISVTFPEDYMEEQYLEEGETSLNGKTLLFKSKISKIERPVEETMNDEWVAKHKDELSAYSYDASTVDELKSVIKKANDEYKVNSILQERGREALSHVIESSTFSSYPEDELNTLIEQTKSNLQQEYEAYKDMMEVSSLEEYLKTAYELEGDNALDTYASNQAQDYLKNKMAVTLIADSAGIEIGEDEVKELGNQMALYYGFESYDAMLEQYGDTLRNEAAFEKLFEKVVMYLGSVSDPSLEPEDSGDISSDLEEPAEAEVTE